MSDSFQQRALSAVLSRPRLTLGIGAALIVLSALPLVGLRKDTTIDAFVPLESEPLRYRDRIRETFGLKDPLVVAVVAGPDGDLFAPETLELIEWLTEALRSLDGVDPERVTSLATERGIRGTDEGMEVEPFLAGGPYSPAQAERVREEVLASELHVGRLVARDGSATMLLAELLDPAQSQDIYPRARELVEQAPIQRGESIHVAGEAAVTGYLGTYIDSDALRFYPLVFFGITVVLLAAHRSWTGVLIPLGVAGGTAGPALGLMIANGIPFYVITNALPVILVAISVADSIHILGEYQEQADRHPDWSKRELITRTMERMWRPVAVTSITTAAGFIALAFSSDMPPFQAFGHYAAFGVMSAMVLSMTCVPAALLLLPFENRSRRDSTALGAGGWLSRIGHGCVAHRGLLLGGTCALALAGVFASTRVTVDDVRIDYFDESEPLYVANHVMNERLDGTTFFDFYLSTPEPDGLLRPDRLREIEELQAFLEDLPHVNGSTSIVDYLRRMHRAMHGDDPSYDAIPDDADQVAQYLLLYDASGGGQELEQLVDYDYREGIVRARLDTGAYLDEAPVAEAVSAYLNARPATSDLAITPTGYLAVHYEWIRSIGPSYFSGTLAAILAVALVASLSLRSAVAGLMAVVPVVFAVLVIHIILVVFEIPLNVGTMMFGAISVGLGVDFAVHTIDRLILLRRQEYKEMEDALEQLFRSTGRALFFNLAAVLLGFGTLLSSSVPALERFGLLVAVAVVSSFVASLTILPALVVQLSPRFLEPRSHSDARAVAATALLGALGLGLWLAPASARAKADDAGEIVARVNARTEGRSMSRRIEMSMIDRRGKTRTRETGSFRKYRGDEIHSVIYYLSPANVRGTAFLTYDYALEAKEDDQWLYLPSLRRVRRISASDRGDYFLGTDFTYDDVKHETDLSAADYAWRHESDGEIDGRSCARLEGEPIDSKTSKALGYSRLRVCVDRETWVPLEYEYWDIRANPLKTIRVSDIREVDGVWTPHQIEAENHKSGHKTVFAISNVDYDAELDDMLFAKRSLDSIPADLR